MKLKSVLLPLVTLILGVVIGFFSRDAFKFVNSNRDKPGYIERHEGVNQFINPLLACDAADDIISNPELGNIKGKVEPVVRSAMTNNSNITVGVYFRELNDGYWFTIGETEKFVPASLKKVPLMIALLKQAEREIGLLDRRIKYDLTNDYNHAQNVKPSKTLEFGRSYTVKDLIYRMIVYSDNNAFTCLTRIVDRNEYANAYTKLRMLNPREVKDDEYLSVQTYASFFRILYNASYLNRELSDAALGILAQSEFRDGLVAGVPSTIPVAHKFGEQTNASEGTVQLHDCGIIYHPLHPYLLCIMSRGTDFASLDDIVKDISKTVFSEVDVQTASSSR